MRPLTLEMEGFLAYRDHAEIDFRDADLFVLEGSTGAGKSSVIDGMIFALYGTIPRLGHKSAVAPVINASSDVARVRFEFSIDERVYQVARRVERTEAGAKVTEARLESNGKNLESGSKEVTQAVAELLGLAYEHFTKAVVLPQGAFAEFLTDTPGERQDLLRALLDLGLFEKIKIIANERAAVAKGTVNTLQAALDELDLPDPDEIEAANTKLAELVAAEEELGERTKSIQARHEALGQAADRVASVAETLKRLDEAKPPPSMAELSGSAMDAVALAADKKAAVEALSGRRSELLLRIEGSASKAELESWRQARKRLVQIAEDIEALGVPELESALSEREAGVLQARHRFEATRTAHSAHELARALDVGDVCPVCERVIEAVTRPVVSVADELEASRAALRSEEAELAEISKHLAQARGRADQMSEERLRLEDSTTEAPSDEEIATALSGLASTVEELGKVDRELEEAATDLEQARQSVESSAKAVENLSHALYEARATVSGEGPPKPTEDVLESWNVFDQWRRERIAAAQSSLSTLEGEHAEIEAAMSAEMAELAAWAGRFGIAADASITTSFALSVERQRNLVVSMDETAAKAEKTKDGLEATTRQMTTAAALGQHLKANNFEAWVMAEALDVLVEGANELLKSLSSSAYSLLAEKGGFSIVDHRNADLIRTTRSLSGGEVFLVSLALALSMATQLADLTGSASRLESVFLDEGFGSLDTESLDTVAAVLDELVVQGRTVGIVTHVRELAERIPVRFVVVKGPTTATVERRQ